MVAEHAHPAPPDSPPAPSPSSPPSVPSCLSASVPSSDPSVPSCLSASVPSPSPLSAASALLSSSLPLPELAASLQISLDTLVDLLASEDGEGDLDLMVRLTNLRAQHKQAQAKIAGLTILEEIARTTDDQQERRRAATALVRGHWTYRPTPSTPSTPSPRPSPIQNPQSKIQNSAPRPDHDPRPSPDAPPYSAAPDTTVARDLATLQSLTTPDPTTAFIAIYPHLAVPAKEHGRWNEPFKNDLAAAHLLNLEGVQISQHPAVIGPAPPEATALGGDPRRHGSATATVRVDLAHPGGRTTGCTFHLVGTPSFWRDDPHPTRWATLRIEPHETG
jgi:hypothetical protein